MLKKTVEYTNYNGQKRTQELYFNMNKYELTQMMVGENNVPFQEYIQRLVDTRDASEMIRLIKDLLLMSYGEKSADGEHFLKNDKIKKDFETSAVFSELYIQLASNVEEMLKFIWGIMPPDMRPEESAIQEILSTFNEESETVDPDTNFRILTDVEDKS